MLPYVDPEKQREAMREIMRKRRAEKKAEEEKKKFSEEMKMLAKIIADNQDHIKSGDKINVALESTPDKLYEVISQEFTDSEKRYKKMLKEYESLSKELRKACNEDGEVPFPLSLSLNRKLDFSSARLKIEEVTCFFLGIMLNREKQLMKNKEEKIEI